MSRDEFSIAVAVLMTFFVMVVHWFISVVIPALFFNNSRYVALVILPAVYLSMTSSGDSPKEALGLSYPGLRAVLQSVAMTLGVLVVLDIARMALGIPVVAPSGVNVVQNGTVARVISLVLVTPIVEELTYRGMLLGIWRHKPWARRMSVLFSTLLWTSVHLPDGIMDAAQFVCLGCLWGILRVRSRSLALPVVGHIVLNTYAVTGVLWHLSK